MHLQVKPENEHFFASGCLHVSTIIFIRILQPDKKKCLHIAHTVVSTFKGFIEIDFCVNLDIQVGYVHYNWKRLHILELYFIAQKIKGAKTVEGGGMGGIGGGGGGGVGAGEYCSRGGQARRVCICQSSQREVVVRENCCGQYFV
jgi:hypothetical protein